MTTGPTVTDTLLALSARKWEWMSAQQVEPLDALFHDAAVFVHMGVTFDKAGELGVIRSGEIHYRDFRIAEATARVVDATGVVVTTMELTAVVGGAEVLNPFSTTETYVRQGGEWVLTALAFTKLVRSPFDAA